MRFMPFFWIFILLAFSYFIIAAPSENYIRAQNMSYFLDTDSTTTVESVLAKDFTPLPLNTLPPLSKTIWYKIPVPAEIKKWNDRSVLYTGSNETMLSMHGYAVTKSKITDLGFCDVNLDAISCGLSTLQYAFPATEPGSDIYLQITTDRAGINREFYFMSPTYFSKAIIFITYFVGGATGIFIIIAILSLLFFVLLRDKSFLFYSLFYVSFLVAVNLSRGIWDAFVPYNDWPKANAVLMPFISLPLFFDVFFIKILFDFKKKYVRINFTFSTMLVCLAAMITLMCIPELKELAAKSYFVAVAANMLITLFTLTYLIYKNERWSIPVATAWGLAICSNLIWTNYRTGNIEGSWFFGLYSIFGRLLECLILNAVIFQKLQLITMQLGFAKAKEQESKIVKTLLRTLTHDLSNTTQVIHMNAQTALRREETEQASKNFFNTILEASKVQIDIIKYAKKTYQLRGQQPLHLFPVNIKDCITKVLRLYQNQFTRKNIELISQLPAEDLFVLAEGNTLVHQVLANLISNAIKFTPSGKKITVTLVHDSYSDLIDVSIRDEGIGIPDEIKNYLFDESRQISRPGTDNEDGTGNGLLIVKDFVEAYGALLDITSSANKGT
ncbi:MAG: sensor histidine kinase, partial [Pseudobdellovibrio sp.]